MTERTLAELVAIDVDEYSKELMSLEHHDERIDKMLVYMQTQLSHGELHPLSRFWKMRKFCLDHFKENIPASKRLRLWEKYRLVIDDIMKLKQMIDEKSTFEKEQIEQALGSISLDIEKLDQLISQEKEISIPKCPCLQKNASFYQSAQKELNVFSSYAKKLNALKKEILSLDISFKKKQEILDRIHLLADQVFPKKRELLKNVSHKYIDDIQFFIKHHFSEDEIKTPIFQLKDQIKQLQLFAKVISLNVEAFSQTRQLLSECWDKLKSYESNQRKMKEEKKALSEENFKMLSEKIAKLKTQKASLEKETFSKEVKLLGQSIQREDILKFQKKQLQDQLDKIDDTGLSHPNASEEEVNFLNVKKELQLIQENLRHWDFQTLDSQIKSFYQLLEETRILDSQQTKMERELFNLKESMVSKLLEEIKDRIDIEEMSIQIDSFKSSLKRDMENYRKILSSSNQSIEKAIVYNELLMQSKALFNSLEDELRNHSSKETN